MFALMSDATHSTVRTWPEFHRRWAGVQNFLMEGECVPFDFEMQPLASVVEEMRADVDARITPGTKGNTLQMDDMAEHFRAMPVEQAMEGPFALAHFKLARFDAPGKFLHGFEQGVMEPWRQALANAGFTWDVLNPIIFISGKGCATNYHMDFSHVLAWQIYGTKRFCGLQDPHRWTTQEMRVNYRWQGFIKPADLTEEDALCYDMQPGAVLWNALLTPHWVEAGTEVALSVNLSHKGLRYHGQLCPHEDELEAHRTAHPEIDSSSAAKY